MTDWPPARQQAGAISAAHCSAGRWSSISWPARPVAFAADIAAGAVVADGQRHVEAGPADAALARRRSAFAFKAFHGEYVDFYGCRQRKQRAFKYTPPSIIFGFLSKNYLGSRWSPAVSSRRRYWRAQQMSEYGNCHRFAGVGLRCAKRQDPGHTGCCWRGVCVRHARSLPGSRRNPGST